MQKYYGSNKMSDFLKRCYPWIKKGFNYLKMSHLKLVTFTNGTHKNADSIYFTSSLEGIFMTIHVQLYSPLNLTEYNIIYYLFKVFNIFQLKEKTP